MREHLTRREMKRDEVQEWMGRSYVWVVEHLRLLALLGVVALVALCVTIGVVLFRQYRASEAQTVLARGLKVFSAPIVEEGASPEDPRSPSFADEAARRARARELFEDLRSQYRSTPAGQVATVYLGRIAAAEGDTALARELWMEFLDSGREHVLTTSVQVAVYGLDRQEGKSEELIATLRSTVDAEGGSDLPPDVLLNELAVTLEAAGRREEAKEILQRLVDEYPGSPYAGAARARIGPQVPGGLSLGT